VFTVLLPSNNREIDPQTLIRYDTDCIGNDASNRFSIVLCVFVRAVTFLPSRCLVTTEGYTDSPTDSPLIQHGPHRKRLIPQFFYCVCIRCRGKVFSKPLPSNVQIRIHRLMGSIYHHLWHNNDNNHHHHNDNCYFCYRLYLMFYCFFLQCLPLIGFMVVVKHFNKLSALLLLLLLFYKHNLFKLLYKETKEPHIQLGTRVIV
jgi:hypothetical protein